MFDVLEVKVADGYPVRVIATNKDEKNAEAIVSMAVHRRGIDGQFFTIVEAGKYADGDQWFGHKSA